MIVQSNETPYQLAAGRNIRFELRFHTTTELKQCCSCSSTRTDCFHLFDVGVGRRAILGRRDKFSQGSTHPRVDPPHSTVLYSSSVGEGLSNL